MIDPTELFNQNREWAEQIARRVLSQLPDYFRIYHSEDLIQEAQMELWRQARKYKPEGANANVPFRGAAYIAIRGAVLMKCRRNEYEYATRVHRVDDRTNTDEDRPSEFLERPVARRAPERAFRPSLSAEREAWLGANLRELPVVQRYLFLRVYRHGADIEELARTWQVSSSRLAAHLATAVRSLRIRLKAVNARA